MPDDPSPIRIVWIFPTLDYGGAERQHLELACAIDKRRFDPHVVLLNDRRRLLDDQYGRIDGLYEKALKNGARGGKLLGAGAAGFLLLYAQDHRPLKKALGQRVLPFRVDREGTKIIFYES